MTYTHISKQDFSIAAMLLAIPFAFVLSSSAFAAEVQLFSNESREENANSLILDNDDTGGDVVLQFGATLGRTLSWDTANAYFDFNDDVNIQGDLTITGTVDGVDVSVLGTAVSGNTSNIATNAGNISTNSVDIATNASDITNLQATSGNATGTNQDTFILDGDDTGGDVTLQFGTTLNETLLWDSANARFDLSDDINIQGDITLTGTVDGVDIATLNSTVSGNTSNIATNASNITTIQAGQGTQNTNIATNSADITTLQAGQGTQNTNIATNASDIAALETINSTPKAREYQIPLGSVVVRADGTDNAVNVYRGTETGANPHEFNRSVSSKGTTQDLDLEFKAIVPSDFASLGNISVNYKVEGSATLDIVVTNAAGATLASASGLNSTAWSSFSSALAGTVSAGEYVYITATVNTSNNESVYFGETTLDFNTNR